MCILKAQNYSMNNNYGHVQCTIVHMSLCISYVSLFDSRQQKLKERKREKERCVEIEYFRKNDREITIERCSGEKKAERV
jgi:hypothetical protein